MKKIWRTVVAACVTLAVSGSPCYAKQVWDGVFNIVEENGTYINQVAVEKKGLNSTPTQQSTLYEVGRGIDNKANYFKVIGSIKYQKTGNTTTSIDLNRTKDAGPKQNQR